MTKNEVFSLTIGIILAYLLFGCGNSSNEENKIYWQCYEYEETGVTPKEGYWYIYSEDNAGNNYSSYFYLSNTANRDVSNMEFENPHNISYWLYDIPVKNGGIKFNNDNFFDRDPYSFCIEGRFKTEILAIGDMCRLTDNGQEQIFWRAVFNSEEPPYYYYQ